MRQAILENKKVVGFEPMQEEMSEKGQEQKQKQVDYVMKKYGYKKGK